mgnify:CR=1 FL=1
MEKYDNSVFYKAYKSWLDTNNKKYWDIMFIEVLNCCTSQCKKKAKGIILPDLEGKAIDATCKVMQKIQDSRPDIKSITSFCYWYVVGAVYDRPTAFYERCVSYEAIFETNNIEAISDEGELGIYESMVSKFVRPRKTTVSTKQSKTDKTAKMVH